jgi:hypothetical protein
MFSSLFSRRKGIFKKALPVFLAFCFVVTLLSGCAGGGAGDGGVIFGDWSWSNSSFSYTVTITGNRVISTCGPYYEASIESITDSTAPYGVLIIKFIKYADWDNPPATDSHANVGKYGALYWKDLTASSVYLADAYTGFTHALFDNLATAKANFTIDKTGDYIDWGVGTSPLTK